MNSSSKEREIVLMSYVSTMIDSFRRRGYKDVNLSESLIDKIKEISKSDLDFEDFQTFENIKQDFEKLLIN